MGGCVDRYSQRSVALKSASTPMNSVPNMPASASVSRLILAKKSSSIKNIFIPLCVLVLYGYRSLFFCSQSTGFG